MFSKIFDLFVNFILKIILNKIIFGIITTLVSFSIYFGVQGTLLQIINFLEIIIGIDTWIGSLTSKLIIFFNNLNSQQIKSWLFILTVLTFINYSNKKSDFSPQVHVEETMKLNEFNNAFQTEQDCLKYIASLKKKNVSSVLEQVWILLI